MAFYNNNVKQIGWKEKIKKKRKAKQHMKKCFASRRCHVGLCMIAIRWPEAQHELKFTL